MNEQDLVEMLRVRYSDPEWAFLTQVRNQTGYGSTPRTADAIAMSLYPSRGFEFYGFEIKCARKDWINDLNNPEKADSIAEYCNRWWVVESEKDIVKKAELPKGWGLMCAKKNGLHIMVQADLREACPADLKFVASLLRNAQMKALPEQERHHLKKTSYDQGKEAGIKEYELEMRDSVRTMQQVKDFEKASGLNVSSNWRGGTELGKAAKIILDGGWKRYKTDLEMMLNSAERIKEELERELKETEAVSHGSYTNEGV